MKRYLACALLALPSVLFQQSAFAVSVVAYGEDTGYSFVAHGYKDADEAASDAMRRCKENAEKCRIKLGPLFSPAAIAIAKDQYNLNVVGFSVNADPKMAYERALASCKKFEASSRCMVTGIYWEPGTSWAAWAVFNAEDGEIAQSYYATGHTTKAEAENDALKGCEALSTGSSSVKCTIQYSTGGDDALVRVTSDNNDQFVTGNTLKKVEASALEDCKKTDTMAPDSCRIVSKYANFAHVPEPKNFKEVVLLVEQNKASLTNYEQVRLAQVRRISPGQISLRD